MVYKDLFLHPVAITQQSAHLVEELQQNPQQTTSASTRQQAYMWEATPQGRVKLNLDEALDKRACKMGVGVVIRGSEGQILATLRMQHHLYPDHFLAEALATLQASLFYKSIGYSNVLMEADSLQVVNGLNSTSDSITYAGQFIVDTRYNLNNFCDWSVRHIVRVNNLVAHALSKDVLRISDYTTSFDFVPPCIHSLV